MVSVIDLKTNTVSTVNLGGRPWYVAVTPDGKSAYVVDIGTDNIYVIDTATNTVVDTVKVGESPGGVAVTPDGKKAYVVFSNSVGVIDTATNTVIATVPVGEVPEVLGQFIGSVQVKTTPTITWNNPADITSGTSLSSTQLNAVAKDPDSEAIIEGVFTYNPAAETVLNAGMGQTLHVDFVPTDTANYTAASKEVTINVLEEPAVPVADFSASPTTGKAPLTVAFTDSSTGSPTTWSWNFGDKSISTDKNPVHTYNKQGKYTVSLTVGNAAGSDTKTIKKYITVKKE
jgi:YVTN family beta-propeller protein